MQAVQTCGFPFPCSSIGRVSGRERMRTYAGLHIMSCVVALRTYRLPAWWGCDTRQVRKMLIVRQSVVRYDTRCFYITTMVAARWHDGSYASMSASDTSTTSFPLDLIPTGIPGLDRVLGGGMERGALALVMGLPGSGKTTLTAQIAFAAAATGKTVLILSALSEPLNKLINHLRPFAFFDPDLIGGNIQFLSLQQALPHGLEATGDDIINMVRKYKADILVLDGFRGMRDMEAEPLAVSEFLFRLGGTLGVLHTTTFITIVADPSVPHLFPEATTADCILGLFAPVRGVRQTRCIQVIKRRGAASLLGMHTLTLSRTGLSVYPQFEERVGQDLYGDEAQAELPALPFTLPFPLPRASFGIADLDAILDGGIVQTTSTILAGSLGTGKTLLGMYFALAALRRGERVVFLSFHETWGQLQRTLAPFGLNAELASLSAQPQAWTFLHLPPINLNPDIIGERLLAILDETRARYLVVDSIGAVEESFLQSGAQERLTPYLAAVLAALNARQITALFVKETPKVLTPTLDFSADPLAILAENVVLTQQLVIQGRLRRVLTVVKQRFSDHSSVVQEFRIHAPEGIDLLGPFRKSRNPSAVPEAKDGQ